MSPYSTQSAHNKKAHDFLGSGYPEYLDWQITTLFYSALHLFNHHFALRGIKMPDNHRARTRAIERELPSTLKAYLGLKSLSEQSRYGGRAEITARSLKSALELYSEIAKRLARSGQGPRTA